MVNFLEINGHYTHREIEYKLHTSFSTKNVILKGAVMIKQEKNI